MNRPVKIMTADDFVSRLSQAANALVEIATDLVAAIDTRPEIRAEILEKGISEVLVDRLERLGRGQIHPSLVLNSARWTSRVMKLPLSQQREVIEKGVEVLQPDEVSTRMIPLDALSSAQTFQVFRSTGEIRSIAEQRTYIQEQNKKAVKVEDPSLITYEKDGIHVGKILVTPQMMARWMEQRR